MLYSENPHPSVVEFRELMRRTDIFLNDDASNRTDYYATRDGKPLEEDVKKALDECSKGTAFEGTIKMVSGQKFPDIVANKLYGVEVKSTKANHWTSTGSSILETTRVDTVEHIYMTFGKLGGRPIRFLSKPYEQCLYGIAVTHMPRYLINMQLHEGETIFEKMGVPYDTLRKMDDPITPVAKYYRSLLKPGESLWWSGNNANETVSATIRLWRNVPQNERRACKVYGFVHYPQIFKGDYDDYSLWLTSRGIVDSHIRDQFSAGGQEDMTLPDGTHAKFPAIYRRVKENIDYIIQEISSTGTPIYFEEAPIRGEALTRRALAWIKRVSELSPVDTDQSEDALCKLFFNKPYASAKVKKN